MKSADLDDSFDYLFKIVLIGDPGVGKTCIVQRFKKGTFVERHGSTIGVDFTMKTLVVDSKKVKVSAVLHKITIAVVEARVTPKPENKTQVCVYIHLAYFIHDCPAVSVH